MDGLALLGLLLIAYAAAVIFITVKKPEQIWNMAKRERKSFSISSRL